MSARKAAGAADMAGAYGLSPDEWQRRVLAGWLAESESGRWAASRCGLAVPRQNGKNAILEVRELYGMAVLGERFLHTAHEVKTARKAFARLSSFFTNPARWPEMAALVREVRRTNGQEAIVLVNGGSVEFVARSRGSGRGYTVDVLVCDEAQELTDEQLEALLPTISSAPTGNPQTILTGTPPPPGTAGEVFARYRADALEGSTSKLCWHEWSVVKPEAGEVDTADPRLAAEANPALGIRLHPEVVDDERAQMSVEGFCRERFGMWETASSASPIEPVTWQALRDSESRPRAPFAFGVAVNPDRSRGSIVVAAPQKGGAKLVHVEITSRRGTMDYRPGTSWIIPRLVEIVGDRDARVVLDPSSPAGSLLTELRNEGIEPELVSGREYAQACGAFYDAATGIGEDGTTNPALQIIRHLGQAALSVAVDAGRKRKVGESWVWHPSSPSVDIEPLRAATLALHGVRKPSKRRKPTGQAVFV